MTVLCVHSTGTGPFMWDFLETPGEKLQPPNLGYPPLEPVARGVPVTVDDDVKHLLAQLPGDGTFDVVSHSYGGTIVLKALAALGPRVRSLFFVEPVLFGALLHEPDAPAEAVKQVRDILDHPTFIKGDATTGGDDVWLEVFIDFWNRPGSWARLNDFMKAHSQAMGWKMFNEVRSVFLQAGRVSDYPLPKVPVTLVVTERSPSSERAVVEAIARHNPHAELVELKGTGHMVPLTHPQKLNDAFAAHLAKR
ncbi:MAG: alpha/beta hydrolase [Myxococcaceae bacterium]|nr:alpha/beta hydrolase [Myxococcaceae bacterium]